MRGIALLILLTMLLGCALFKKTTKTTVDEKQELKRQTELNKLAVKTGQKETNVYTYWPDGSVYQWENRVEQLDEARFGKITVDEKAVGKKDGTRSESVPSWKWMIAVGIGGFLLVIILLFPIRNKAN